MAHGNMKITEVFEERTLTDPKTGAQRRVRISGGSTPPEDAWAFAQQCFEVRLRAEEQAQQVRAENPDLFMDYLERHT